MKSVATVTLGGTLEEKLAAIAGAGFSGVEVMEKDLSVFEGGAGELARRAEDLDLEIVALQPMRDFEGSSRQVFQDRIVHAHRMFDAMETLGTRTLLLCSNVSAEASGNSDVLAEDLLLLAEQARRRGLRVGYEALSWATWTKSYRDAWRLVKKVGHPNLGLVLDTFHTCCLGDSMDDLASIPPERIFLVQVADAPRLPINTLQWSRRFRCLPGIGDFDLASFLAPLLANRYRGYLSIELFSDIYASFPPETVAGLAFASLAALEASARELNCGLEVS